MKPFDGRYQTATKVNVLSPISFHVGEVDNFHLLEDRMIHSDKVRNELLSWGLRQWYDIERKLQELGRSKLFLSNQISIANLKKGENRDDNLEVGLAHSKGVAGVMPCEAVSHLKELALLCKGKGKHKLTEELGELCLQN